MSRKSTKEQVLLEKLEEVITHADIKSKQAIKSASFGIEQTVEILHSRKRKLEDTWDERKILLEQAVQSSHLDEAIRKCLDWLQQEACSYFIANPTFGSKYEETHLLLEKHREWKNIYKERKETVHDVIREGQKLVHTGHFDSATIKYKIGKLEESYLSFSQQLDQHETLLDQTLGYFQSSAQVLTSLKNIQKKLGHKSNDIEKAKYRAEATEVSSLILREGQMLMNKTKNQMLLNITKAVKDNYESIMSLTDTRHAVDDKEVILVNKDLEQVTNWILNVCEDFVNVRRSVGANKTLAAEYLKDHQQLLEELNDKAKQLSSMQSSLAGFAKKKKKYVLEIAEKIDVLMAKSEILKSRLKFRNGLVEMYCSFIEHSDQVLKKIFLLEEELTSDEPHENINATSSTLNRQKQEKEEIINSAEILQEEGQRILEDLSLCSEESALDRNGIKLKIGKDLKNIVMHTMQLEELWEQRETQLDTNKRLSTQFFEFEKEIRKVIGCINDQSETFFPVTDEFAGLAATRKDIEEKLTQVCNVSKMGNTEIENHLKAAEMLAKSSDKGTDSAKVVTSELKLLHQKFKTKLSKYEVLLSICSTFYTSVEKVVTLMNKSLQEYTSDFLPRDTAYAQQRLKDHHNNYHIVEQLFLYTIQNGQDVLQSIREFEELGSDSKSIDGSVASSSSKENWKDVWEGNHNKLDENLMILQYLQDISQITLLVEEYTRQLLKINRKFGNSLLSAVTLCQESDSFQDQVKSTELQIGQLRTNISKLLNANHPDGKQLESKLNLLEKRWFKLIRLMEEHKTLLNTAVEFYQLYEQVETWIKDSKQFLKTTRGGARRCTSEKDVRELLQLIDNFKLSGVEIQESRLLKLSEVSTILDSEDAKRCTAHLKESQEKINFRLEALRNDMENYIICMSRGDQSSSISMSEWDDDDLEGISDVTCLDKRIILSTAPSTNLTSDISLQGDEVMKWSNDVEQVSPKLLVTVTSNTQVPVDMQQRISPIVCAEINNVSQNMENKSMKSTDGITAHVKTNNDKTISVLGPQVYKEISVKTDYDIETSPPSPLNDERGLTYTMKKTLVTTTKEVTTHTRQEIKTQLEVFRVDSEEDLPKRLALTTKEPDKIGVSVTTKSCIENTNRSSVGENCLLVDVTGQLQNANENICKGVENNLFSERSTVIDDSLLVRNYDSLHTKKNGDPIKEYEITAKDANNKGITVKHIPKHSFNLSSISGDSIPADIRPMSMVELTLNLNEMDLRDLRDDAEKKDGDDLDDSKESTEHPSAELVEDEPIPMKVLIQETETSPVKPMLEKTLSDSDYTDNLAREIIKAGVSVLDVDCYIKQLKEEEKLYENLMTCTVKSYMDKIAVAPLKLQKNKDAIFRNIKELIHFHKSVFSPKLNECHTIEDIVNCYLKYRAKISKMYYFYISKGVSLESILTNTSYFQHCPSHKSDLKDHLLVPQEHLLKVTTILDQVVQSYDIQKKDTNKLKFIVQMLKDINSLVQKDPVETEKLLEAIENPVVTESKVLPTTLTDDQGEEVDKILQEYEIIGDSKGSYINSDVKKQNPGKADNTRYVVCKGYTAKKKDEIQLPLGSEVCILETDSDRSFVIALNKKGQEFDRGWVPSYSLQCKEDAVDIRSKEAQPPKFLMPLAASSTVEGTAAKLAVQVGGFPKPEIVWYLDGLPVRSDINHRVVEDGDMVILNISPAVIDDEGLYTVKAVNALGSTSCQAEFIVESDVSSMSGLSDAEWEDSTPPIQNFNNNSFIIGEKISFNAAIGIESGKAFLPPSFSLKLKDKELVVGTKATFQVKVQGDPLPDVSWYLNDSKLESDKRLFTYKDKVCHTLTIMNVSSNDEGILRCELTNSAGSNSCSCKLTIGSDSINNNNNNPSVYASREIVEVCEDHDAELIVEYSGDPHPEIKWFRDEIHLTKEYGVEIISEGCHSKLILPEVTKDDSGVYKCFVKNTHGETNCEIVLSIINEQLNAPSQSKELADVAQKQKGPPEFYEMLFDKEMYEGDTATFQVKVLSSDDISVKWFHEGKELNQDIHYKFEKSGEFYRLVIPICECEHAGKYTCMAENIYGKASCSSMIKVNESIYAPKFVDHSKDLFCEVGKQCRLSATISGKPEPKIEWYKENKSLLNSTSYEILRNGNQHSLVIPQLTDNLCGTYKCAAYNDAGESACIINVTMLGETFTPKFVEPLCDINAEPGDTVKLESTVKSKSNVDVKWYKNGEPVEEGEKYKYDVNSESHALIINSVSITDSGVYKCEAKNVAGGSCCECNLVVAASRGKLNFSKGLSDLQVAEHEKDVEMKVILESDSPSEVLFYKDGAVIESGNRRRILHEGNVHILHWKYVLPDDTGEYVAIATNDVYEEKSKGQLQVFSHLESPKFTDFQSSYIITNGELMVLSATATGIPLPFIQWFQNNNLLESNDELEVLQSPGQCTIKKMAALSDAGDFVCIAQNNSGKIQASAHVTVNGLKKSFAPEFSSKLSDVDVNQNDDARLELGFIGNPEPKILWKKDGKVITENKSYSILLDCGISSLIIKHCQETDAGCFECVASNSLGEAVAQCMVTVSSKSKPKSDEIISSQTERSKAPKFLKRLYDVHVAMAEALVLETVVAGDPFPDVRWYKQDKLLHPGKKIKISSNGRDGKCFLRLVNIAATDCGEYECVAKNKHGETSMSCEIFLKEPTKLSKQGSARLVGKPKSPSITNKPIDLTVNEGEKVEVSFMVSSNPKPRIEIFKDGKAWKIPSRFTSILDSGVFTWSTEKSILSDEGIYEFLFSNDFGKDSCKIEILVDESAELEVVAKTIGERRYSKDTAEIVKSDSSTSDSETNRKVSSSKPPSKRLKRNKKLSIRNKDGDETDTEDWVDDSDGKDHKKVLIQEDIVGAVTEEVSYQAPPNLGEAPDILENFSNMKVLEGKPIKMSLKFKGIPSPEIQWFKDGNKIYKNSDFYDIQKTKDSAILNIINVSSTDAGEYTCVVENDHGKKSCKAKLEVLLPVKGTKLFKPEWVQMPKDVVVTEGTYLKVEVIVTGQPLPDVQFLSDNRILTNTEQVKVISDKAAGKHSINFTSCQLRDAKSYKCVAKNNEGSINCFFNLKVKETELAPQFVNSLSDCEVVESREVKFKVEVTGKPKPLIEWFFNNQLLKPSPRVKIRTEREFYILQMSACKFEDEGEYKVVASNIAGEAEMSCLLKVVEDTKQPEFIYIPKQSKTVEGRACSFRVSFNGKPNPDACWFLNGDEIRSTADIKTETGKSTLSIKSVELADAGIYTCVIKNKAGSNSCDIELCVDEAQSRPVFLKKLLDESISENDDLCLSVTLKGKPKPVISWFKDDVKLSSSDAISFTDDGDCSVLSLHKATLQDGGIYKCSARNVLGESNVKCKVNVNELMIEPVFETLLHDIGCVEGEAIDLSVTFRGKPKPRLRWLKNGIEIEGSNDVSVSSTGLNGSLKLTNTQVKDAGIYECVAQNKAGIGKTSCTVTIKEALSAPLFPKKPNPKVELIETDDFVMDFCCVGKPVPKLQVHRDGKKILKGILVEYDKERGNGFAKIAGVTKLDEGMYTVQATNSEGTNSFSVYLEVKDAIELMFTKKLSEVEVVCGKNVNLEVMFKGHVVDVDWYKDDEYIDESEKYAIIDEENKCTCIIHNSNYSDAGTYRCDILNEKKSMSCSARLSVVKEYSKPVLKPQETSTIIGNEASEMIPKSSENPVFSKSIPGKVEVILGNDCVLTVAADGKPKPKLTFYKDGSEIKCSKRILILPFGKNMIQLKIKEASLDDEGEYSVKATNVNGSVWCKGLLYVQSQALAPKFVLKPTDLNVVEGKPFKFQLKVTGAPVPEVKVFRDDVYLQVAENEGNLITFSSSCCSISDGGKYKFEASNVAGVSAESATLFVEEMVKEAVFQKTLQDVLVMVGQDLLLDVVVDGNPPPKVSFFKGSKKVTESKRHNMFLDNDKVTLKVLDVELSDAGKYSCEIRNEGGQAKCHCNVIVQLPPKPPVFKSKLNNLDILEGDSICMEVEVEGNPTPTLTWQKNDLPIPVGFVLEEDSRRIFKPICELGDKGLYKVTAVNQSGKISCLADVKITASDKPPVFEKKLSDQILTEDDTLYLEVVCKGYPPPELQWYKDDILLDELDGYIHENDVENNRYSVINKSVSLGEDGMYTVLAVNSTGEATCSCDVEVNEKPLKPKFLETFVAQNVYEGDDVVLMVKFIGKPWPDVSWYKGNEVVSSNVSVDLDGDHMTSSLVLPETAVSDSGYYCCVAKNSVGDVSHTAKIIVNKIVYPPEFEIHLSDEVHTEGAEVLLTTVCNGSLPLTSKWMKNNRPVYNTSATRLEKYENKFMLRIPKAVLNDSGVYNLEVSNSAGTCQTSCNVVINEAPVPPSFLQKLRDLSSQEGKDCEFVVKYNAKPAPEINWTLNGETLIDGDKYSIINKSDTKSILRLKNVTINQCGVLKCSASNVAGTASTNCKINIAETNNPPEFLMPLTDMGVMEGEEIFLKASVSGKPLPKVIWMKSRQEIKENDRIQIIEEGVDHYLRITNAQLNDQGRYKIVANNVAGELFCYASVSVEANIESPMFLKMLEDSRLEVDNNLNLLVEVTGSPKPKVEWQKDGKPIKDKRYQMRSEQNFCQLELANATTADGGVYTCMAFNKGGKTTTEAIIEVYEKSSLPVFTSMLSDCIFNEGEDIILSVNVIGNPRPEVKFFKDKKLLQNIDGIRIVSNEENYTVTIDEAEVDDGGEYECRAQNEFGDANTSCNVKINEAVEKPILAPVDGNDRLSVAKNGDAVLEVEVYGNPLPMVEWARGDLLIDPTDKFEILDEEGFCSLIIHNFNAGDAGEYTCIASNNQGEVEHTFNVEMVKEIQEKEIKVEAAMAVECEPDNNVIIPDKAILGTVPSFSMKPKSKDVPAGGDVRFTCNTKGEPDPILDWYFGKKVINTSEKYQVKNTFGLSTLVVKRVDESDIGDYKVISKNAAGECEATFTLSVQGKTKPDIEEENATPLIKNNKEKKVVPPPKPKPVISQEKSKEDTPNKKVEKSKKDDTEKKLKEDVPVKKTEKKKEEEIIPEPIAEKKLKQDAPIKNTEQSKEEKGTQKKKKVPVPVPVKKKSETVENEKSSIKSTAVSAASKHQDESGPTKPVIGSPLKDMTVLESDHVVLRAEFAGHTPMEFSWFKDDEPVGKLPHVFLSTDENIAILEIKSADIDDEAEYMCRATNKFGCCETSSELLVDEKDVVDAQGEEDKKDTKPERSVPPTKKKAPVPLPDKAKKNEGITVPSEKETKNIREELFVKKPPPVPVKKPKPAKLSKPVKEFEEAVIEPQSISLVQETPSSMSVKFVKTLEDSEFCVNDSVELEVVVNIDNKLKSEWFLDGDKIEEEEAIRSVDNPPSYKLKIDSLLEHDEGEYSCILSNQDVTLESSCLVKVHKRLIKPEFLNQLEGVKTYIGDFAEFSATASGCPSPQALWYFKGQKLSLSYKYDMGYKNGEYFLIINDCSLEDAGEYTIQIENSIGKEICGGFLEVEGEDDLPLLIVPKGFNSNVNIIVGDQMHLEVDCDSETEVKISWMKDGKEIYKDDKYRIEFDGVFTFLIVEKSDVADSGTYTCVATNKVGTSKISFQVNISG